MKTELPTFFSTSHPPELGPGPRPGIEPLIPLKTRWEKTLDCDLALAVVFLWHDHLEAAHEIAQRVETPDGSYIHAIMHRREPDYWNSKYWFRRVGEHPVYASLAAEGEQLLTSAEGVPFKPKLIRGGKWDPCAFVDLCEQLAASGANAQIELARSIQAAELKLLFQYLVQ